MRGAQACLEKHGIRLFTVGIDPSPKVAAQAKTNMNVFLNKDVLEVACCGKADVVICANVVRFVDRKLKQKILKKCAQLLKPEGVLIVSAGRYRKFEKEIHNTSKPRELCDRGLLYRIRTVCYRLPFNDVMSMNKDKVGDFAEHILEDYNSKGKLRQTKDKFVALLFGWLCR